MSKIPKITKKELEKVIASRSLRMELARKSPYWFFHIYFSHYIKQLTADFHREMFRDLADDSIPHLVFVSFRGSAKSTIVSMAFPLWAMIGTMEEKFVILVSQTQTQVQQHLRNLRDEIESNELFRKDFGKLEAESNEWGITSLSIPSLGAKIMSASRGQNIRGMRSGANRLGLVISDDIEDLNSVKTTESRRDTYEWFNAEIMGIGDEDTRYVTIGNLLHEDSLVMRLKTEFAAGMRSGVYKEFPIIKDGKSMWPGKYPDLASISTRSMGFDHATWQREFMLQIVPRGDQIVTLGMIKPYTLLPERLNGQTEDRYVGVDLAISVRNTADYTSMVTLIVRGMHTPDMRIYVLPNPINERMRFNKTIDTARAIHEKYPGSKFIIENVAYQDAAVQSLQSYGVNALGVKPEGDKATRLNVIADRIERGIILFPEKGCELLIAQLTGFGVEKHDDLMDALTIAVIEIIKQVKKKPSTATFAGSRKGGSFPYSRPSMEVLRRNTRAQYSVKLDFNEFG